VGPTQRRRRSAATGTGPADHWARQYSLWPMFFGFPAVSSKRLRLHLPLRTWHASARRSCGLRRGSPTCSSPPAPFSKKIAPVILATLRTDARAQVGDLHGLLLQLRRHVTTPTAWFRGSTRSCPWTSTSRLPPGRGGPAGTVLLQKKIMGEERPTGRSHLEGGTQGTRRPFSSTSNQVPRPRARHGRHRLRGTSTPAAFPRQPLGFMWTPPARRMVFNVTENELIHCSRSASARLCGGASPCDMPDLPGGRRPCQRGPAHLKHEAAPHFKRLEGPDRRRRYRRAAPRRPRGLHSSLQPAGFDPPRRVRLKVPLNGADPAAASVTDIWPSPTGTSARSTISMGRALRGPPEPAAHHHADDWEGHPLRKNHPGRATEMAPYTLADAGATSRRMRRVREGPGDEVATDLV